MTVLGDNKKKASILPSTKDKEKAYEGRGRVNKENF